MNMPATKHNLSNIYLGSNSLPKLQAYLQKRSYGSYFIICDEHSLRHCLPALLFHCETLLQAEMIELESGEDSKTMDTCMTIWSTLQDLGADKKSLIINLGGGVITDTGGFVASVYKRGVDFVHIPTTLLAMVDAAIGGKNGVDLNHTKNQLGTIAEPELVVINPEFLSTLSQRQVTNGLAEVIKIALVRDEAFFKKISGFKSLAGCLSEQTISHAVRLKQAVVKQDPHEKGLRKCLNFGHSIGHALESACIEQQMDVLHGEAVAAGMIMETYMAWQSKRCTKAFLNTVVKAVQKHFAPIVISQKTEALLLQHIRHDKKNEGDDIVLAVAPKAGSFELLRLTSPKPITEAIRFYNSISSHG